MPGAPSRPPPLPPRVGFGVNELRLNGRQWLAAFALLGLVALLTPSVWERIERFETGPDYRLPYSLSKDYWLYARRLRQAVRSDPRKVFVLGDSVVWGEYVAPDGTLTHFLNEEAASRGTGVPEPFGVPPSGGRTSGTGVPPASLGQDAQATTRPAGTDRFINGGLNGLFPLAQEGLLTYYGAALRHQKVILHCNVLWLTSPKADLSTPKEESFNHSRLVPQFWPRIPCYRAEANERLSALVERKVGFIAWIAHLQNAYFHQESVLSWTLEDDGGSPPCYTNCWRNPLAQITLTVPRAPKDDPDRGPASKRHKPWSTEAEGTTRFEWVDLEASLQWRAFQRVVRTLQARDNDVLVVLGPFNEHIMAQENRPAYRKIRDGIAAWLTANHVAHVVPETLPSGLYADASHPLTEGYRMWARGLYQDSVFRNWLAAP
jgi:hypothetical protein